MILRHHDSARSPVNFRLPSLIAICPMVGGDSPFSADEDQVCGRDETIIILGCLLPIDPYIGDGDEFFLSFLECY